MIIAHDLGTTGDKATLVDESGRIVASATVPYHTDFGPAGKAEQNASDWWDAVCEATRSLRERTGAEINAVSFSGQMMGAVLLDAAGEPVRPAIIWADTRSTRQTAQLVARVGMDRGYAITGHRLNPTYSLSKVMWVRDEEPAAFARTRRVALAKDYIVSRLTRRLVTDPSDASSTNAFDQGTGAWSDELIGASGLERALFPEIVPSTTVVGRVTPEAAEATGLPAGTPVVLGGGDGPMAALGTGIVDTAAGAYCYLGSSSWVSYAAEAPLHDPAMRTMTFNHVIPGRYVPTATMQAGGASLQWIMDVLEPDGADRYARTLSRLAQTAASADGLYFLPHLLGERSPYWNPRARAAFVGLARHHGRDHLVRAVVEGIGFNLFTGIRAFTENGARVTSVQAIGGAANSAEMLQVICDIWGLPVAQRNLADEATSLGAAVVAGVGIGIFDDFAVAQRFSRRARQFDPDPAKYEGLAAAYPVFMDAYRRLEPWFETI